MGTLELIKKIQILMFILCVLAPIEVTAQMEELDQITRKTLEFKETALKVLSGEVKLKPKFV